MGALPAVLGLVVLFIVFSSLRPETFTSNLNIANLLVQASAISVLAMGLVPVLLLGEIDLSAGVTGGMAAGFTAVAIDRNGQSWPLAVLIGLAVGALVGLVIGAARRQARHPVVRGHAGVLPRPAGRHPEADRPRRHHPGARRGAARRSRSSRCRSWRAGSW